MPARSVCRCPPRAPTFPETPANDHTFTHERCRVGDEYLTDADHPLNPRGNLSGFTTEELETGCMVYIFPIFTMAMRAGTNNWLSFRPAGPERTGVLGGYLMWKDLVVDAPDITTAGAELIEKVNNEDALATTELVRMMRSRKAVRGSLSHFEKTIAQFYKYLGRTRPRCIDASGGGVNR